MTEEGDGGGRGFWSVVIAKRRRDRMFPSSLAIIRWLNMSVCVSWVVTTESLRGYLIRTINDGSKALRFVARKRVETANEAASEAEL